MAQEGSHFDLQPIENSDFRKFILGSDNFGKQDVCEQQLLQSPAWLRLLVASNIAAAKTHKAIRFMVNHSVIEIESMCRTTCSTRGLC